MHACVRACMHVCVRACVHVCMCVAKPVAVELRCHATALILVIGKAQFRRAMLSCDSSCFNFVLCNFANVISRKVLQVEARNFYQLVEYNEKIIW